MQLLLGVVEGNLLASMHAEFSRVETCTSGSDHSRLGGFTHL